MNIIERIYLKVRGFSFSLEDKNEESTHQIVLRVAGLEFENRGNLLSNYRLGDFLKVVPDLSNEFDSNALAIIDRKGHVIGYVDRVISSRLGPILKGSAKQTNLAQITELKRDADGGCGGLKVSLSCSAEVHKAVHEKFFIDFLLENSEKGYYRLMIDCSDTTYLSICDRMRAHGIVINYRSSSYKLASNGRHYDRYLRISDEFSEERIYSFFKNEFNSVPSEKELDDLLKDLIAEGDDEKKNIQLSNDELRAKIKSLDNELRKLRRKAGENARIRSIHEDLEVIFPEVISGLLPNLIFEGDSLRIILQDLKNPLPIIEHLARLNLDGNTVGAKRWRGTQDWREVRFKSGNVVKKSIAEDFRLYFNAKADAVYVLVGEKKNQDRDKNSIKEIIKRLNN